MAARVYMLIASRYRLRRAQEESTIPTKNKTQQASSTEDRYRKQGSVNQIWQTFTLSREEQNIEILVFEKWKTDCYF